MSERSRDDILDARVHVPDEVARRAFSGGTVFLNTATSQYHGLNPNGSRILEALDGADTVRSAVDELAAAYDHPRAEIEADVVGFCADLADRGLIELQPAGSA